MKALVVCGFAFYREALCSVLCQIEEQLTVMEARDPDHALSLLEQSDSGPDVTLVNYDVVVNGLEVIQSLKSRNPEVPIIVLSRFGTDAEIRMAVAFGASGCIAAADGWKSVCSTIKRVRAGEMVLAQAPSEQHNTSDNKPTSAAGDIKLTPRQFEVLELIRRGKSNKEIARNLDVAEGTVKMHCVAIFRELSVTNRTQAAVVGDHLAATRGELVFSPA